MQIEHDMVSATMIEEASQGMSCPVCGGVEIAEAFRVQQLYLNGERFSVLRCSVCGLGRTVPPVPSSEIHRWYPATYYGEKNFRFRWFLEVLVRFSARRRAKIVGRNSAPGPVLDVGCGAGITLSELRSMGYEPHGVELNETAAWHAKHRLGIKVHVGDFLTAPYAEGQFTAIIFWHSLEHLDRPVEAIRHAHRLLKPGGILVVAVPNSESFQARWFGPHWFHLDIPRHYFHFGMANLGSLLTATGFRVVETSHLSLEQSPYGWIQTMHNAMGFESNLLYSMLKHRTACTTPINRYRLQALVSFAALPVLFPLAFLLTGIETVCRRGGTIDVCAIKPGLR